MRNVSLAGALRGAFDAHASAHASRESTPPNSPLEAAPTHGPHWLQVGITIANCLVGAGCLGLPYALRQAGWAGLLIILLATLTTCITAKMLVASIETLNTRKVSCTTYDELVERTFGCAGGVVMKVMTVAELYGGVVCMVTLHAVNWPVLLQMPAAPLEAFGIGTDAHVVVSVAVSVLALPTLLVQARYLSAFAAVGLTATLTVAAVTVIAPLTADMPLPDGAACPVLDASTPPGARMGHELIRLDGVGVATGLALFAFAGHATFPEMWRQMPARERAKFGQACDVGFGLAALFYTSLAALGYFFFGACAADSLTLNLMDISPALGRVATCGVLLSTFTSISVLSVPVARICREAAACGDRAAITRLRQRASSTLGVLQHADALTLCIKVSMMTLAAVLATTVPNFGLIVALIGAFTCMLISLVLPALCHLAVHRTELSLCSLAMHAIIVLAGLIGMVIGVQGTLAGASADGGGDR